MWARSSFHMCQMWAAFGLGSAGPDQGPHLRMLRFDRRVCVRLNPRQRSYL